jgi:16S rRNA (guanine1207-N2)-methyltransferase
MTIEVDSVSAELLGHEHVLQTAPGLFSAGRVDDGTRLLLSYLPRTKPTRVLDLGCGYGALGLPIAVAYPEAHLTLVDRDLLAVELSGANSRQLKLANVECRGSLGYRDVADSRFDWVLCNVPARIGDEAIAYILGAGAARLATGGELRIVVIRDLEAVVQRVAAQHGWPVEHVTSSARHGIFRLPGPVSFETDHESVYLRDTVKLQADGELLLQRPHDISEDPGHLREGLPLLLECLPRRGAGGAFVWRGGYGAAAIVLARRGWQVSAADKDLLATTFTRRNAARLGVAVTTTDELVPGTPPATRFDLIVGELATPAGAQRSLAEIDASLALATPKATVLWLGPTRAVKSWLIGPTSWKALSLASRGAFSVVRIVPST